MTRLCILPGLDGTTALLSSFIAAMHPSFASVDAVPYPAKDVLDYAALESLVRAALPTETPFVLLGESFSGPIAIAIAANPPPNLIGLVLSTTFARAPVPLLTPFAGLTRFAPVHALPITAMSWYLLGRWSTPELRHALKEALRHVAPQVLRARAAAAMRADVRGCLARIYVPTLYLHARHDRLLPASAGQQMIKAIADAQLADFDGPHLLLQTQPLACAARVARFAAQLT